jgi:hypothetical protein
MSIVVSRVHLLLPIVFSIVIPTASVASVVPVHIRLLIHPSQRLLCFSYRSLPHVPCSVRTYSIRVSCRGDCLTMRVTITALHSILHQARLKSWNDNNLGVIESEKHVLVRRMDQFCSRVPTGCSAGTGNLPKDIIVYARRAGLPPLSEACSLILDSSISFRACLPLNRKTSIQGTMINTPLKMSALCMLSGGDALGPALRAPSAVCDRRVRISCVIGAKKKF